MCGENMLSELLFVAGCIALCLVCHCFDKDPEQK